MTAPDPRETRAPAADDSRVDVAEDAFVLPVVQEDVEIHKETVVTGTVRIQKHVETEERFVDVPLERVEVEVTRMTKNEPIDAPLESWQEGDTTVIPVIEEVFVVEKRFMLKELVYVTRRKTTEVVREKVELRSERVDVSREGERNDR